MKQITILNPTFPYKHVTSQVHEVCRHGWDMRNPHGQKDNNFQLPTAWSMTPRCTLGQLLFHEFHMYHDCCSTKRGMICCNMVRHRKMENMSWECIVNQPGGVGNYGACMSYMYKSPQVWLVYFILSYFLKIHRNVSCRKYIPTKIIDFITLFFNFEHRIICTCHLKSNLKLMQILPLTCSFTYSFGVFSYN